MEAAGKSPPNVLLVDLKNPGADLTSIPNSGLRKETSELWAGLGLTALFATILFGYCFWRLLPVSKVNDQFDFHVHFLWVKKLVEQHYLFPHPLFHLISAGIWAVTGISLETSAYLVAPVALNVLTACGVFYLLFRARSNSAKCSVFLLSSTALGLSIAGPFSLWSWPNHLYLGYFSGIIYHNPTYLALKPVALLLFFHLTTVPVDGLKTKRVLLLGLLTVASGLAKPNYNLVLLLALPVFWFLRRKQEQKGQLPILTVGVLIPAILVLGWQFISIYNNASPERSSGIILAPLLVARSFSNQFLVLKLATSITFPLAVLVLYRKRAWAFPPLQLAWLSFAFAISFYYLLAESGPRRLHGNFAWSAHICTFLLFVSSVMFLLERNATYPSGAQERDPRLRPCLMLASLHIVNGLVFYSLLITGNEIARTW